MTLVLHNEAAAPVGVALSGVGGGVLVGGGRPQTVPMPGPAAGLPVQMQAPDMPLLVAIAATLERAAVDLYFGPAAGAPKNVAAPTLLALLEDGEPANCLRLVLREPGA